MTAPPFALTLDESQCIESLGNVYLLINGEDFDASEQDKDDLARCVRCLQDRIFALPSKRRLRVERDAGGQENTPGAGQ